MYVHEIRLMDNFCCLSLNIILGLVLGSYFNASICENAYVFTFWKCYWDMIADYCTQNLQLAPYHLHGKICTYTYK